MNKTKQEEYLKEILDKDNISDFYNFLAKTKKLDNFIQIGPLFQKSKTNNHKISINGDVYSRGLAKIDDFKAIIHPWQKILLDLIESNEKSMYIASFSKGSFETEFLIEYSGQEFLIEEAFEDFYYLFKSSLNYENLKYYGRGFDIQNNYKKLLKQIIHQNITLNIKATFYEEDLVIDTNYAKEALRCFEQVEEERTKEVTLVGKLIAANLSNGRLKIELEEHEIVSVQADLSTTSQLEGKILGKIYLFEASVKTTMTSESQIKKEIYYIKSIKSIHNKNKLKKETPIFDQLLLSSDEIPQANSFPMILKCVKMLGESIPHTNFGLSHRTFGYYKKALEILDIANNGILNKNGMMLYKILDTEEHAMEYLCLLFEESKCIKEWLRWSEVNSILEIDIETTDLFLNETTTLSKSTISRRASTLKKWVLTLSAFHPQNRPATLF